MVVIDMDMPKSCEYCKAICSRFNENEKSTEYYCGISGGFITNFLEDLNNRDKGYCPIKCDIEDIKAEIEQRIEMFVGAGDFDNAVTVRSILNIIDKHTQ